MFQCRAFFTDGLQQFVHHCMCDVDSCAFQVFQEEMGVVKSYNLKPGGDKIPVTKQNRKGESTLQSPLAVTHLQGNKYSHWRSKSILYLYEPASLTAVQYSYF